MEVLFGSYLVCSVIIFVWNWMSTQRVRFTLYLMEPLTEHIQLSYPIKQIHTLKSYLEFSFLGRCSRSVLGRKIGLMTIRDRYVEKIIQIRKPS